MLSRRAGASVRCLAVVDTGFGGVGSDVRDPVIVTGFTAIRAHELIPGQKDANRVLVIGRAPVKHGFVHLGNWRAFTKLRIDPARATRFLLALLVLEELGSQPLTDDLLRRLSPTTSVVTWSAGHASPLTCDFKLAEAQ